MIGKREKRRMYSRALCILLLCIFSFGANAKRFRNAYVSFELPPNWNCKLEGSEWVCENEFSSKTKEAIIILTAKEVGPADTLAAYLAHLKAPRTLRGRAGQVTQSKIIHVKERVIGNHPWVDAMHLGSEVGPYFTRYLATIKERIAILVTFSAHKEHFTKYSSDFIRAVDSLKVVATKDTLGRRGGGGPGGNPNAETIGAPIGQNLPFYDGEGLPEEKSGSGSKSLKLILLALVLAGIGGFFYMRQQKGNKKVASKSPKPKSKPPTGKGKA